MVIWSPSNEIVTASLLNSSKALTGVLAVDPSSVGSVVGSVVGIQKYVYDIFGPAVNLATRLQEFSEPMQISVEADMADRLREHFELESMGEKDIHGFSRQAVWRLRDSRAKELASRD